MTLFRVILNPRTFLNEIAQLKEQPLLRLPLLLLGLTNSVQFIYDFGGFQFWTTFCALPLGLGLAYLIFCIVIPGLILLTGKIWRGEASMRQLSNVLIVSYLPLVLMLPNQILLLVLGKNPELDYINPLLVFMVLIWSFGLLVYGVSKVQKFSYGMALLNIIIAYCPSFFIGLWVS